MEASWQVACRSLHEAFRTNRLKHVVVAAYQRPSLVGEAAGSRVPRLRGCRLDAEHVTHIALLCEYACLYLVCSLAPLFVKRVSSRSP
jgi:hypothetical protein